MPWYRSAGALSPVGSRSRSRSAGDETPAESSGLRILAGARLDPFFIALTGVRETRGSGRLSFKPRDTNALEGAERPERSPWPGPRLRRGRQEHNTGMTAGGY